MPNDIQFHKTNNWSDADCLSQLGDMADDMIAFEGLDLHLATSAMGLISSRWIRDFQGAVRYEGKSLDTILRGVIQRLQNKPPDVCSETSPLSYISTTFYNQTWQASPAPCQAGHRPVPAPALDTVSRHFDTLSDLPGGCPGSPAGDSPLCWDDSFDDDAGTGLQPTPAPCAPAPLSAPSACIPGFAALRATGPGHQLPGLCPDDPGRAGRDSVMTPWPSSFISTDNAVLAWRGDLAAAARPLHETHLELTAASYSRLHSHFKSRYPLGLRSTGQSMHTIRVRADHIDASLALARELFEMTKQPVDAGEEIFPFVLRQQGGLVSLLNLNNRDRQTSRQNKLLNELAKCRLSGQFITLQLDNDGAWPDQERCEETFHELWAGIELLFGDSGAIAVGSLQFSKSGLPHAHLFSEKNLDPCELESLVRRVTGSTTVKIDIQRADSAEAVCRYVLRQSKLHVWKPCRQPKVVEPVLEVNAEPEIKASCKPWLDGIWSEPMTRDEFKQLKQSLRDLKDEWKVLKQPLRAMRNKTVTQTEIIPATVPSGSIDLGGGHTFEAREPLSKDEYKHPLRPRKVETIHEVEILELDEPGVIDLGDGDFLEDPTGQVRSAIADFMVAFERELELVNKRFPIHLGPVVEASNSCRQGASNDTMMDTVSSLRPP